MVSFVGPHEELSDFFRPVLRVGEGLLRTGCNPLSVVLRVVFIKRKIVGNLLTVVFRMLVVRQRVVNSIDRFLAIVLGMIWPSHALLNFLTPVLRVLKSVSNLIELFHEFLTEVLWMNFSCESLKRNVEFYSRVICKYFHKFKNQL